MSQGIDFNETFAPVPCMSSIRAVLALAAKYDWEVKQGDVNTAFLCADMDTDVEFTSLCQTGFALRQQEKSSRLHNPQAD